MLTPRVEPGLCDNVGTEVAAGARLILHDKPDGGVFLLQPVGDQARYDVRCRSGSEGHHNAHGLCWPVLRRHRRGTSQQEQKRYDGA